MGSKTITALALLVLGMLASAAGADPQSKSWANWTWRDGRVQMVYTLPLRDASALASGTDSAAIGRAVRAELNQSTQVAADGADCEPDGTRQERARTGYLRFRMGWQCPPEARRLEVSHRAMLDAVPSHIHFARFRIEGMPPQERLFSRRAQQHSLILTANALNAPNPTTTATNVWQAYTLFGFEHILVGVDHIAFLLGLLLLARRIRDVILVVTGFTLGHSATLALTALGLVTPEQALVEGLIGYTIALVALENVLEDAAGHRRAALAGLLLFGALALVNLAGMGGPSAVTLLGLALFTLCYLLLGDNPTKSQQLRPILTLLFGLIHGFGFAGVLMEVGLPENSLIAALLAFNIGVELGQVAIVLALGGLALVAHRFIGRGSVIQTGLNASLCGLGVFWFAERLY